MAAFSPLTSLRGRFLQLAQSTNEQSARAARSELLREYGEFYQLIHPGKKSFLRDDGYLKKAEQILNEEVFTQYPGSYSRLRPLAERCVQQWFGLNKYFSLPVDLQSSPEFIPQLDSFVRAYKAFLAQFIDEYKVVGKSTATGAQVINPKTLKVFYSTVLEFLLRNPSIISIAREKFETADPMLFDLIAYCGILTLLANPPTPDQLPEFFAAFESKLNELRETYCTLRSSQQKLLFDVIFLNPDERSIYAGELTEEGKAVFQGIYNLIYDSRKGLNQVDFVALNKALFAFINEDLQLAKSISSNSVLEYVTLPVTSESVILVLNGLSEPDYDQFKTVFLFLPAKSELLQTLSSEIENRRLFYRLTGIVALAKVFSNTV